MNPPIHLAFCGTLFWFLASVRIETEQKPNRKANEKVIESNNKKVSRFVSRFDRTEKGLERLNSSKSFSLFNLLLVAGAGIEPATS